MLWKTKECSVQSVVYVLIIKTIIVIGYIYGAAKLKKNDAPEYNIIFTSHKANYVNIKTTIKLS